MSIKAFRAVLIAAGMSRQAFHKQKRKEVLDQNRITELVLQADSVRKEHPGCGVEKLYDTIRPYWAGRDKTISLLMEYGFRLKRKRNYTRTTFAGKKFYPNLIEGMMVNRKNQVWQSDITYIKVGESFCYIVLIIDVYTKQVIGYNASGNMFAEGNLEALKMALTQYNGIPYSLIHHSDRGSQYTAKMYTDLLDEYKIHKSMAFTAQDNAYAERINGTIKNEYLSYREIKNLPQLRKELLKTVSHYNCKRIHRNLPRNQTPEQFAKSDVTTMFSIYSIKNKKKAFRDRMQSKENTHEYHQCLLNNNQ
jgi:putative transposase